MAVALLETPLSPTSTLGPYRKADYFALPEEPRCELIYGRFYVTPSPTPTHQRVVLLLGVHLNSIAEKTGGYVHVAPLDVTLGDYSVVQPDILYLSPDWQGKDDQRIEGAPDLVVEVISPSSDHSDHGEKLKLYAESGVREYWLVDPAARRFQFLVNHNGHFEVELEIDGRYRSPILPEIEIDLAAFWKAVDRKRGRG
ncbi:MAG TPA: Uma2 family endonuclease [Thermoanaerobaculia bacterium]